MFYKTATKAYRSLGSKTKYKKKRENTWKTKVCIAVLVRGRERPKLQRVAHPRICKIFFTYSISNRVARVLFIQVEAARGKGRKGH